MTPLSTSMFVLLILILEFFDNVTMLFFSSYIMLFEFIYVLSWVLAKIICLTKTIEITKTNNLFIF